MSIWPNSHTLLFVMAISIAPALAADPSISGDKEKITARLKSVKTVDQLSRNDRLEVACDVTDYLSDDLKVLKLTADEKSHLQILREMTCGTPNK